MAKKKKGLFDSIAGSMKNIDLNSVGKNLKQAADQTAKAAGKMADNVKNIDLSEVGNNLRNTAESVVSNVKNIDMNEVGTNIRQAADETVKAGAKAVDQAKGIFKPKEEPAVDSSVLSTDSALKVLYYLMAADGHIEQAELEKFEELGKELAPDFAKRKSHILAVCKNALGTGTPTQEVLESCVDKAIRSSRVTEDSYITPKVLVWDLLTVAYSDGNFDPKEKELVDYLVKCLGIDHSVYLELQSSLLTLMDIDRELAWIKTTDRPYLTIEAHVNELNERNAAIVQSIYALVTL